MAAIYFFKDGGGDEKVASEPYDISIELVSEKLDGRKVEYSKSPPRFNPEQSQAALANYRYVVVETFDGEVSATFPMPGYYYVVDMSPEHCRLMFNL